MGSYKQKIGTAQYASSLNPDRVKSELGDQKFMDNSHSTKVDSGKIFKITIREDNVAITNLLLGSHTLHQAGNNTANAAACDGTHIGLPTTGKYADVDNYYKDTYVHIISGTGAGQVQKITAYDGTTKSATVSSWSPAPDGTSVFEIIEGKDVLSDYNLSGILLLKGEEIVCRRVPFGLVKFDFTLGGSAFVHHLG